MMTLRIKALLLGLFVVTVASTLYAFGDNVLPETDWQPVIGEKGMMYDRASLTQLKTNSGVDLSIGDFLVIMDKPTPMTVDGKTFMVRSATWGFAADCKNKTGGVFYEVYYDNTINPKNSDKPVFFRERKENVFPFAKKSPILQILCPNPV